MATIITHSASHIGPTSSAPRSRRVRAAIELLVVVALLEVGMWELCGPFNEVFRWLAPPLMALIVWTSYRRLSIVAAAAGDAQPKARCAAARAWIETLAVTALLALLIPVVALATRIEGEGFRLFWLEKGSAGLAGYLASKGALIVVQQMLLQHFLLPCCLELLSHRRLARACAALLFGVVHLPSMILVGMTAIAGWCWLGLFARSRRPLPLVASHLALAVLAHAAIPERLTLNMRVGAPALEVADRYQVLHDPQLAAHVDTLCSDRYYAACGGTDADFIGALYRDLLQRQEPASDVELRVWQRKLAAHARTDIVVEFCRSREFVAQAASVRAKHIAERLAQRLSPAPAHHKEHGLRR